MHPAYSVIVFTTASGAGYGLLFWLSLAHLAGYLPGGLGALAALVVALALITVGLLSSTLHLGHPKRAWRALSQWRSSWLSREGVAAIATYLPAGLLALLWLLGSDGATTRLLALLAAAGACVTVYCTGMIYGSLRTIRQWHQPLTPVVYLALASATGALMLGLIGALAGAAPGGMVPLVVLNLLVAGGIKLTYWRKIDNAPARYTAEMALGLPGPVRPLEPPHTRPNFVMREMGYQVARRHTRVLRRLATAFLFVLPLLSTLLGAGLPAGAPLFYGVGAIAAAVGVVLERWLFFAEAEHVSQLYYGAQRA